MITITKEFPRGDIYPIESATKGLTPILFDIETTGLSAKYATIYLIGAIEVKRDRLNFVQWFAEGPAEDQEVLEKFLSWLPDRACLITFNGKGFDIPFLCKKCKQYNLPCYLPQMPSIDLYGTFGPLKKYFDMSSRRLVAYEQLIGLNREDVFNGGELVNVYKEYVGKSKFNKEAAEELKTMLLLHNEEDIKDMVPVMGLLNYIDLINGNFKNYEITEELNSNGTKCVVINLELFSSFPIAHTAYVATLPGFDTIEVITEEQGAKIKIPITNGTFKHFFDDYRNYYYLPEEDTAVHKSIAASVDSTHREQATKATAYAKASGDFLPQLSLVLNPSFKKDVTDRVTFVPVQRFCKNEAEIRAYIKALF